MQSNFDTPTDTVTPSASEYNFLCKENVLDTVFHFVNGGCCEEIFVKFSESNEDVINQRLVRA